MVSSLAEGEHGVNTGTGALKPTKLSRPAKQFDRKSEAKEGFCFADMSLAHRVLKYEPQVKLEHGLEDLAAWLEKQTAVDRAVEARAELAARGLMV